MNKLNKNIYQKEILYSTKFLELKSTHSPNGKDKWVYAHRPNASNIAVIAPILHNNDGDSVLFIETKRPPLYVEGKAETSIEFPAGLVGDSDKNETVNNAIIKELLEETGYNADSIEIKNNNLASSPGALSEISTVAIAHINKTKMQQNPISDNGVIINRYIIPLKDVDKWLDDQQKKGKAISAQTLSGMYYVSKLMKY